MTRNGYTTHQVTQATGLTRRQLAYWQQTSVLRPRLQTRGGHARYTLNDIILLAILKRMLDNRVSLQRCKHKVNLLRDRLESPGTLDQGLYLLMRDDLLLLLDGNTRYELINGEQWLFSVTGIRDEIIGQLHAGLPLHINQLEMFPVQNQ